MTTPLDSLYNQALKRAEQYLDDEVPKVDTKLLIRIFLTALLDNGYGIAPLEPTDEMVYENDPETEEYHRTLYKKMMARRPRLNI
jgi:hypothetical protein